MKLEKGLRKWRSENDVQKMAGQKMMARIGRSENGGQKMAAQSTYFYYKIHLEPAYKESHSDADKEEHDQERYRYRYFGLVFSKTHYTSPKLVLVLLKY